MARDLRLVDELGLELAHVLCQEAIHYLEQQLGTPVRPCWRRLPLQLRMMRLWWRLTRLERVIGALRSLDPPPPLT